MRSFIAAMSLALSSLPAALIFSQQGAGIPVGSPAKSDHPAEIIGIRQTLGSPIQLPVVS
jgi:hypothetical protein